MNKKTLNFLKWLEEQMDNYNGENGTNKELCCFCKAIDHNGEVGIIHKENCPIIKLRKEIRDALVSGEEQNE